MINWKTAAKYYRTNWIYCDHLSNSWMFKYQNMRDRAKRAEAEIDRLIEAYNTVCDELRDLKNNGS